MALTRTLAQELYGTYHNLLPHIADLPAHLQGKVLQVHKSMEELQTILASPPSLVDLPSNLMLQSRQKIAGARENLDELLDFMVQCPPAHWLSQAATSKKGKQPTLVATDKEPKEKNSGSNTKDESSPSQH